MRLIDLTGRTFGRLTVVSRAENMGRRVAWHCACECGNTTVVPSLSLTKGYTKSCGCWRRDQFLEIRKRGNPKHGHATGGFTSRTYNTWMSMWQRCTNPKFKDWKYYGGRGVKIAERWLQFDNFLADMGERPVDRTLDRIDTNGDYEPGNCRWATTTEQSRNRRNVKR